MKRPRPTESSVAFSDEAGRVLARARAAARRFGHAELGTEHLLLGLLEEPHGLAAALLRRAGVEQARVEAAVALLDVPSAAPLAAEGGDEGAGEFAIARPLRHALQLAAEEARRLGDPEVRSEHLLLAVLRASAGHGAVVLGALGINTRVLRLAVLRERPGGRELVGGSKPVFGLYRVLAALGGAAVLAALAGPVWWLLTVPPFRRQDYLYLLLIPLALAGIGLALLGSSRAEAQRQEALTEALLAAWRAERAPARIAEALRRAEAGDDVGARATLLGAVTRPLPEEEYRAALAALAPWQAHEALRPLAGFARAELHAQADRTELAVAELAQVIARLPNDEAAYHLLGELHLRAGRYPDAIAALRRAVALRPDAASYRVELAWALLRAGELMEAEAAARESGAAGRAALATALLLRGALDDAEAVLAEAPATDTRQSLVAARAALRLRRGEPAEALRLLAPLAAAFDPPAIVVALEGWAALALGNMPGGRAALGDARGRDPLLAASGEWLARALDGLGRPADAAWLRARARELTG
ncbi:MAG TPA: Clp protease N-terminal domain-containing protein [Ktedonobacterales bacterium]|nr:Clp protease N-terminal domain-containing protein [Ktedonobacterales bacterium]